MKCNPLLVPPNLMQTFLPIYNVAAAVVVAAVVDAVAAAAAAAAFYSIQLYIMNKKGFKSEKGSPLFPT